MFVYKKLKPSDVSITPFEAHKQYTYDSSSAGNNGITFNTALWTSESKAHYSSNNLAGNFQNHRNYFQFDKVFYRDYITDNANLIPDVNYIKQERRLYDKVNILSIPQGLFGNRIQPTTFNLTGSFHGGSTIIEINDDGEGNIYPSNYILGSTNWPSEKRRVVYIGPVKGFKKKDLNVLPGTGNTLVNTISSFTKENIYDDSYYLNQVDYNNITFNGDTPLTFINIGTNGYLRLDHDTKYNFGFDEDFNISFYVKTTETDSSNITGAATNDKFYYIAKSDIKTIVPNPGEGQSEILSTFISGNLQTIDIPAENKYPFKIYYKHDLTNSGSLFFERSNGSLTSFVSTSLFYSGSTDEIIHISAQKTGSELQLWINGIKTVSGSDIDPVICKDQPPTNEANLYIGSRGGIDSFPKTQLSQIMIWNEALSETQIQNVSESITGTPYIGNIFYDEGFVTINHPSYSDVLQQYSGSSQTITLNPTYGDEFNYDSIINITDSEAWKSEITAYNIETNKIFTNNYSELILGPYNNSLFAPVGDVTGSLSILPGFDYILTVDENESVWNGTIKIQNLSSSFITYSLDSTSASDNPFTPSGSNSDFVDKGSYLLLSSSATTNTQEVTIVITSSSLLSENFILGGGPGASVHNNLGETIFNYTSENDGGVAVEPFPNQGLVNFTGENNQVHLYNDIGVFKTTSQTISTTETPLTFQSSFGTDAPYDDLPLSSGYPQYLGARGLVAEYYNDRIAVSSYIDQAIHNGVGTISIQAFATVNETPVGVHTVTLKLYKNGGATPVATSSFLTSTVVDSTGTIVYPNYVPQQGDVFTLKASAENNSIGPDSVTFLGGTNNNPKTFIKAKNQAVEPGFKNYLSIESDTWSTTAYGYYKVTIDGIRTDNDNYAPLPDEPLNVGTYSDNLGVAIQILKNGTPIHTTVIPKDTNYGDFEHDWIETSTGGTYKIKIFITKDNGATNPTVEAFSIDEGFRMGEVTVRGRNKTNQFTITPALAQAYKTISPGNTNNSVFTFDDIAGLIPDDTIINTISNAPNAGTTITLANSYTITSSIGATASYDEQSYLSASAEFTIEDEAVYVIKDFELGVDETTNLGTLNPRLRLSTTKNGTTTIYGPYVGSQNISEVNLGVLTGSDTIKMDLDIVQNFGSVGSPNYVATATGDGVGFSVDNLNIDAIFPTSSITRISGPSFPSNIDQISFFSAHIFNEGDSRLPFSTGSFDLLNVSYIDGNTLSLDSGEMFITASTTAEAFNTLAFAPLSASILIPAKEKTIYNNLQFKIGNYFLGATDAYLAVRLLDPDGSTITSSLYDNTNASTIWNLPEFTASADGNFKLEFYSSDASFTAVDVTGSNTSVSDYIGLTDFVNATLTSGSYVITKTSGNDFTSNTLTVAITSSHANEGSFPGGSANASFTTGSLDINVNEFISTTKLKTNTLLFITASSPSTGSVNLGNTYFLYTGSVLNIGNNLPTSLLEGNFSIGDTTYDILSVNGEIMSITPDILVTTPTNVTLNYHTPADNEFTVKFKNSHLIFEHEYQCTVDEEEYNYTQNISVKKNKSTKSSDLADCTTGSIDNSQITLFKPYVTSVGLYDDNYNLLAIGKFAQPIKMSEETDMTFVIRWDS